MTTAPEREEQRPSTPKRAPPSQHQCRASWLYLFAEAQEAPREQGKCASYRQKHEVHLISLRQGWGPLWNTPKIGDRRSKCLQDEEDLRQENVKIARQRSLTNAKNISCPMQSSCLDVPAWHQEWVKVETRPLLAFRPRQPGVKTLRVGIKFLSKSPSC